MNVKPDIHPITAAMEHSMAPDRIDTTGMFSTGTLRFGHDLHSMVKVGGVLYFQSGGLKYDLSNWTEHPVSSYPIPCYKPYKNAPVYAFGEDGQVITVSH